MSRIDPVTIILILVLIGLFFRSFVAAAVPPMIIGIGLGISFALVYFLGTYFMDVHYSVLTILLTASLGAGCDYCIFILSRYREERKKGYDKKAAVETSVTWAGEAIATSGLTVIIAFGALSLSSMSYIASMGVLAVGIACALLLALTLLPAILVLLGDRIFWPSRMDREERKDKESYFTRSARFSIKHAKALLIVAVLITLPTTYIVLNTPTSYDYIASMPDSESKDGLMVLEDGFGGGRIIPTYVGMDLSSSAYQASGIWNVTNLDGIEGLCARTGLPRERGGGHQPHPAVWRTDRLCQRIDRPHHPVRSGRPVHADHGGREQHRDIDHGGVRARALLARLHREHQHHTRPGRHHRLRRQACSAPVTWPAVPRRCTT